MKKKSLSLLPDCDFQALPSTKMHPSDRVGVHSWFRDYSAFSESFAVAAIETLAKTKKEVVFDPFLGTGTSLVASSKLGLSFLGVELSPFSALLSRTKVSRNADSNLVARLLKAKPSVKTDVPEELLNYYTNEDLSYTLAVISKIEKLFDKSGKQLLRALIEKKSKEHDSARLALCIVLLAARSVSKTSKGSNPVWFKVGNNGNKSSNDSLSDLTVNSIDRFIEDLNKAQHKASQVKVKWADSRDSKLSDKCFDLLLTSPPYLNRLDYVVNQLPEVILLSMLYDQNLDQLKRDMIGTTKIVEKGEPDSAWGKTCLETLSLIKNHSSKASSTYYIWNYYKYFKDMYACIKEWKRLAKRNAKGLLVVQNSHYKDIDIPVTNIFNEMGSNIGIEINEVKELPVKSHMGLLSPQQREYSPNKVLKEYIMYLEFS